MYTKHFGVRLGTSQELYAVYYTVTSTLRHQTVAYTDVHTTSNTWQQRLKKLYCVSNACHTYSADIYCKTQTACEMLLRVFNSDTGVDNNSSSSVACDSTVIPSLAIVV
jgi:hypothetical protein